MNRAGAQRWWAVVAVGLSMLAVGLDMTVLNTALPTLARALPAGTSQLQWIADAYNLVLAAVVLPAGLLGDRLGHKWPIAAGLIAFAAGSAWCAWSGSAGELIAARSVLGLGAAVLIPLSISVLAVLFEPGERRRAIAVMSGFTVLGVPLGPIVAGVLLQHFWWGSVFVVNLPLAVIGLVAVVVLVPPSRGQRGPAVDWPGIVASGAGLVGLTYGLIESQQHGWTSALVLASLTAGAALLAGLGGWERRTVTPLLDTTLFTTRGFTSGTVLATVVSLVLFGALFVLPQFLQAVQGTDALGTGLRTVPLVTALMVGFAAANRLIPRRGPNSIIRAGLAITAAAAVTGACTTADTGYAFVAAWSAMFGLGVGLSLVTAMVAATDALSAARAGIGSAMLMAARQAGSVIGVALLGTVLATGYRSALDPVALPAQAAQAITDSPAAGIAMAAHLQSAPLINSIRTAFTHGMNLTLGATAGVAITGLLLTLLMPLQPRPTANHTTPQEQSPNVVV